MTAVQDQSVSVHAVMTAVEDGVRPLFGTIEQPRSVGVVGLGYVGLSTALAIAESGVAVFGCDISESRIAAIKSQRVDLLEDKLASLNRLLDTDLLTLTTETATLTAVDTVLICVPTPVDTHLVPDLTALRAACTTAVDAAQPGQTIVLTSTTYVGCTQELLVELLARRGLVAGRDVFVAFSPERIDPGSPSHVPEHTPRVVGGVTEECAAHAIQTLVRSAASVHRCFLRGGRGADQVAGEHVSRRKHRPCKRIRVSRKALRSRRDGGCCRGSHQTLRVHVVPARPRRRRTLHTCDPHYLLWQLKASEMPSPVTEAAMASIAARAQAVVRRAQDLLAAAGRSLAGSRILLVGVVYKPAVADVRESPALNIIEALRRSGAEVAFTDVMVESVWTLSGQLVRELEPAEQNWDLVIAHTLHAAADHSWLSSVPTVLDATYGLVELTHRSVL